MRCPTVLLAPVTPVLARCLAGDPLEGANEVVSTGVSEIGGHFLDGDIGLQKQLLCSVHSYLVDHLLEGDSMVREVPVQGLNLSRSVRKRTAELDTPLRTYAVDTVYFTLLVWFTRAVKMTPSVCSATNCWLGL